MGSTETLKAQLDEGLQHLLDERGLRSLLAKLDPRNVWLVGGLVRDLCLGREVQDVDLVVPGGAEGVCQRLRRQAGGTLVPLDQERGIFRLVLSPDLYVDVANFQDRSLEGDLACRDFTLNAMALPLEGTSADLVDPHHGLQDLADGMLRMVSNRSLQNDPLRIFRAARLGARFDLRLDPATETALQQAAPLLEQVAQERIHSEMLLLLQNQRSLPWLERLQQLGAFRPLLAASGMKRFREKTAARNQAAQEAPETSIAGLPVLAAVWPLSDSLDLRWAALAHDLAGPELNGRQAGALFQHLRLPAKEGRRAAAVYTAPQILQVPDEPAALIRALLFMGTEARESLLLARVLAHPRAERAAEMYRLYVEPREGQGSLVTGKDLLNAGLKPGPGLGRLLEEIEVRWRLGELNSTEEGIAWALEKRNV